MLAHRLEPHRPFRKLYQRSLCSNCIQLLRSGAGLIRQAIRIWLRGLDSNQDNQLQRLACYQLHYPGLAIEIVADILWICFAPGASPCRRLPLCLHFVTLLKARRRGEVSERFKEHAWKACVGETLPWVRIPPSPPGLLSAARQSSRAYSDDPPEHRERLTLPHSFLDHPILTACES